MSEVTPYPIDDPEYMMPQDAAKLWDAKAQMPEIHAWEQTSELVPGREATALKAEGQEVTALQSAMVAEIADRLSRNGDGTGTWAQWLADVELHRITNGTVGQESEE